MTKVETVGGTFHIIKDCVIYELDPEPEGGYTISVPVLQGGISFGDTIDEAMEMIAEAMELYIEVSREQGYDLPPQFDDWPSTASSP